MTKPKRHKDKNDLPKIIFSPRAIFPAGAENYLPDIKAMYLKAKKRLLH